MRESKEKGYRRQESEIAYRKRDHRQKRKKEKERKEKSISRIYMKEESGRSRPPSLDFTDVKEMEVQPPGRRAGLVAAAAMGRS